MKYIPHALFLSECFDYCLQSGVLAWKTDRPISHFKNEHGRRIWRSKFGGTVAGAETRGYLCVGVRHPEYGYIKMFAHRIIWILQAGEDPGEMDIDHIDRNGLNNQWSNLRISTMAENCANKTLYSTNTSGHKGVTWDKRRSRWRAQVMHLGRNHYAGNHQNIEDAVIAVAAKRKELHGEFARQI